jgi:hypothetical protein
MSYTGKEKLQVLNTDNKTDGDAYIANNLEVGGTITGSLKGNADTATEASSVKDGVVTAKKLGTDLIDVGSSKSNGMTVTLSQNSSTKKLSIGLTGTATNISSAATADSLNLSSAVGSSTYPVYFSSDGVPVKCNNTLGNSISGNASTATKLYNSRTIQTDLGSTSASSFDGSINITPGVTGTLPITRGGTGATDATTARSNLGLATVASSGSYSDLNDTPTIPTVNNGTLTIKQNNTQVATFSANQSSNTTVSLTDTTYSTASQSTDGLMSASDKAKLDGIASGAQVNTVTSVNGSTGDVKITYVATSERLNNPRAMSVNLASTSLVTFDGTKDVTLGVYGTLPIKYGGTGATDVAGVKTTLGVDSGILWENSNKNDYGNLNEFSAQSVSLTHSVADFKYLVIEYILDSDRGSKNCTILQKKFRVGTNYATAGYTTMMMCVSDQWVGGNTWYTRQFSIKSSTELYIWGGYEYSTSGGTSKNNLIVPVAIYGTNIL